MDASAAFAIVLILSGPAHAASNSAVEHACVYDYRLISDQECRTYRAKVLKAKSDQERLVLLTELQRTIAARAQERGIATGDWRGLQAPPVRTSMSK